MTDPTEMLPDELGEAMAAPDPPTTRSRLVRMSDVTPEQVSWLWPGRIPLGKLTVLDGDPKLGKSTLMLDMAARVTRGLSLPDGADGLGPASVVLLTAEDGLADTVRPRLDAAGADAARVIVLDAIATYDEEGKPGPDRPPALPQDIDALEAAVVEVSAVLVIVDVLNAFLDGSVNSFRDQDVRRALMPLAKMAERTGCAVVVLRHLNKSGGSNALYRGGGSIGIAGAARSVLLVAPDPDDDAGRVLAVVACNVAAPVPSLAFALESDNERGCSRIAWGGTVAHTATALLAVPDSEDDRTAHHDAVAFLIDYLADGEQRAVEVQQEAKRAGIAERTLQRARARAHVASRRDGFGKGATYWWYIDRSDHARQQEPMDSMDAIPQDMASMASMVTDLASMGLRDLPFGTVESCRTCQTTTVTADDGGPLCERCAQRQHT